VAWQRNDLLFSAVVISTMLHRVTAELRSNVVLAPAHRHTHIVNLRSVGRFLPRPRQEDRLC
jgi:hypothetical protein